jgi:hypothetical protein
LTSCILLKACALRICMSRRKVSIVMNDPALYEAFIQQYPRRLYEWQFHIDDSGERDEERQFWISGLSLPVLRTFLAEWGSGNYALYRDGRVDEPLLVRRGLSRLALS